jgi:hypothetical protein
MYYAFYSPPGTVCSFIANLCGFFFGGGGGVDVAVPTSCVAGILVSSTINKQVVKRNFADVLFLVYLTYTVLSAFILFQVFCLSV